MNISDSPTAPRPDRLTEWISRGFVFVALAMALLGCGGGSSSAPAPVTPLTTVTIHYLRVTPEYSGWGLHLWGDAVATSVATPWTAPRNYDRIQNGAAEFDVPVVDASRTLNFIAHNGDLKSPLADLSIVPRSFGSSVWAVQDSVAGFNGTLGVPYNSEAAARAALAQLGNRSVSLDLSPVAPVSTDSGLPADWSTHANFVEIYVRGFQDSDGDGIGDLRGLTSQLDYLHDEGFTGLWLMPITRSADHDHGYAVEDYRAIEPGYGTMVDFDQLLAAAHARGMAVIIDYVMNHSSSTNPLFLDASTGSGNGKRDWYVWNSSHPAGWNTFAGDPWRNNGNGWYYGIFSALMPDFNLRNPDVVAFHKNNLRFWLNRGVDGFRFDAVGVLFEDNAAVWQDAPENHPLLAEVAALIASYGKRYMVCEAPSNPAAYAAGSSCGRAFGFQAIAPLYASVLGNAVDARLIGFLKQPAADAMPLLLGNHDSFAGQRVWTQLGGNLEQYRLLAASYLLTASTPFTYYGEEIGMADGGSGLSGDAALRTPMSWSSDAGTAGFTTGTPFRALSANAAVNNVQSELTDSNSLLYSYRQLLTLRSAYPLIGAGTRSVQSAAGEPTLRLTRESPTECIAIVVNYSANSQQPSVNTSCPGASFSAIYGASGTVAADVGGLLRVPVPARSAVAYRAVH
ncbi:MAG: alpha-amylase family glycosyl hydrolase [Steroidobacteraceae bacterium]